MKPIKLKIILLLFLLFYGFPIRMFSGETLHLQSTVVKFSSAKLTVKQALVELDQLPGISLFYESKEDFLNLSIHFSSRTLAVQKALEEIRLQAPVEVVFNNDHIIVKSRMLESSYRLSGTVRDAVTGEGLVAATVFLNGTNSGTLTDEKGNFSMVVKPGSYQLVCRFVGYFEDQTTVNLFQDCTQDVVLKVRQSEISEVKISGSHREMEPVEKGRTIEKIESKAIGKLSTNDVNDALQGRVEGVWSTKTSGAPGDHHKIRIRGISSIFGSSDPLYVVDGAIIPIVNFENMGISDLNTHDIDKITILKDASSTALYGNLGSNGVILIDTKKGGGKTQFNFGIKQGFQSLTKRYSLMGAEDFLSTLKLSDKLIATSFYRRKPLANLYERYPAYRDSSGNVLSEKNYQDELFRTGSIREYLLSATGSFKTIDFYLSGNYFNHNGVVQNTNYQKYTVTANLSKVIDEKFSVRLLYKGSHQDNKNTIDTYLGNKVIFKGINYEPAYDATPDSFLHRSGRLFFNDLGGNSASVMSLSNFIIPFDSLVYANNKIKTDNSYSLNLHGFYSINKELSFRAVASLSFKNLIFSTNNVSWTLTPETKQFLKSDEKYIYFNHQYELDYSKQKNDHSFSSLIRYRCYRDNVNWRIDSIANIDYGGVEPEDGIFLRGSQAIYGEQGSVIRRINSAIFNLNYNFRKKYFISWISNYEKIREGTSVSDGQLFNSLAVDWDLAREKFIPFPKFVDAFNLYVNWGQSGNYPLNSLSDDLYSTSSVYTSNDSVVAGAYISNLANHHLRPERVEEVNYGVNFSLFNERLKFSADYYRKKNTNLLIKRDIPLYYGGGTFYQNIGEMENKGLELSAEVTPFNTSVFFWNSRLGFSTNHQIITKLYEGVPISFNNTDIFIPDFIAQENEALGTITGYNYVGKWNDIEKSERSHYVKSYGLAYLKNDTTIQNRVMVNENDKMVIGKSIPDFTCSWLNVFEYKNFSCEMLWYAAIGVDKYNATKASTFITGLNTEVQNIIQDTMSYLLSSIFYESSYFVEDASFIRLKTLSFTYSPRKNIASKIGMEYTLSFENLITLTRYTGYDPEATIYTDNNFTDNAIDKGAYPNPRGVFFTINLTF